MSGTLAGVLSGIEEVGRLVGGGVRAPVSLGGVVFESFEVPEKIAFGGEQRLNVHKLPGGARFVDAMGPDERDIEFSGYFSGPSAAARARQLDAMRREGRPHTLSWADFRRQVVIQRFECDYSYGGQLLPYTVSCVVLSSGDATPAKPGLLASLGRDLTDSLGIADQVGPALEQARQALAVAQRALPVAASLTRGSSAFAEAAAAIEQASAVVNSGADSSNGAMGVLAAAGTAAGRLIGGSGAAGAAAQLTQAAEAAGALAGYVNAQGFVGRAAANLSRTGA